MDNFIIAERDQMLLLPPSIRDWLPEDHLAVFISDIIQELDLTVMENRYRGSGKRAYSPRLLLSLLFYGYATGIFSSRKIEKATYDSVAFRYLSGDKHPDHDTIAYFRKRFAPQLKFLFAKILLIAREMDVLTVGTVAIDGTKVKANASKHKAMSWKYALDLEKKLVKEMAALLEKGAEADADKSDSEMDIPEEIRFRKKRLEKIKKAKAAIKQRAQERHEKAVALWAERKRKREDKYKKTGKKSGNKEPEFPNKEGPEDKDQYNFTDPDSRVMLSKGNFEQCHNAQAAVDVQSLLILGTSLTNNNSDQKSLLPTLDEVTNNIEKPGSILADNGYFSEENIMGCESRNVDSYIAVGRDKHNKPLKKRNQKTPPRSFKPLRKEMWKRVKCEIGKEYYRMRMFTVEAVFGIIKQVMGFRQFSVRGLKNVTGEWDLVCLSYNLRRLHQLKMA